ncbi:hypothetical protein EXIGLDRAFT_763170 [Exidia glandulosa HHB12029]|uniref:Uncharacterized protein n=1 Tax=Exidia glandulosa HHB12029 TaxID=1314781 RepID=A0A165M986_EXIGL|nr:hypothetical protein EXIGLDRAFT_763170 [Exidia glandulosa HHB12029]
MSRPFSLNGPLFSPGAGAHNGNGSGAQWPRKWNPLQIKPWFVAILAGLFVALAVGIEVAYAFSVRNHGKLALPSRATPNLTFAPTGFDASNDPWSLSSTQFLKSFLSTLLITPLVFLLGKQDETIKLLQASSPHQSSATAERSLLLDYITANSIQSIYRGTLNKHGVIIVSAAACVIANLLQPLAGSLFTIRPTEVVLPQNTAIATTQLGLDPTFTDLDAFVAAAGFAEAAAFHNLSDPPFILGTWAVTEFEIPDGSKGNNGSATLQTVGIRSEPQCEGPSSVQLAGPDPNGNYTLTAAFTGCTGQVAIDGSLGDNAGVQSLAGCGGAANVNPSRAGAVFWYFLANPVNATVVLCNPKVEVFNVAASVNATTNELYDVTIVDDYPSQNDVTQFLSRGALNGIAFDPTDFDKLNNRLVQARAISTSTQLPEAALKLALKERDVQQQYPDFLGITAHIYQQYLAIVAKSIFFTNVRTAVPATIRQYQARLWLDPLSCHSLAAILVLTALMILYAQWSHHQTRSRIYLACPPGTIASAITLTSNSRWTALIGPADDAASVTKKLRGMRFRLDPITHHIIVEGEALGQPRNSVPPNSPMLDPRISVYSTSTKASPLPTPGTENKHFSFQGASAAMAQSPMSAQPFSSQPYMQPPPPPENQGLLSPYERVSYHDATGGVHPLPYGNGMPSPTIPRSN